MPASAAWGKVWYPAHRTRKTPSRRGVVTATHMDLLISLSHVLAYLSLAFAIAVPQVRRPAVAIMAAVAVLTGVTAIAGPSPRTLETVHTYAGFEGSAMEVSMVSFPTGSFTADGWQWAMPFAGFAGLWIIVLLLLFYGPLIE